MRSPISGVLLIRRHILTKYQHVVRFCCNNSDTYFITTPIFYVNAAPHIGHAYSAVIADAQHRFQKLRGASKTLFSTGTDEHGIKIQKAADTAGLKPKILCDQIATVYKDVFNLIRVDCSDFVRTTENRHKEAVIHFWNTLKKNGYISEGLYEGWYCSSDETFVPQAQVKETKDSSGGTVHVSAESGHPVEWSRERNYVFRLGDFQERLLTWLKTDQPVKPKVFQDILIHQVQENLPDLSVSRERQRLQWGIPVPGDDTQTIYVWLDALVNYLTVAGYPHAGFVWPPDCHFMGKEILKFHGIYWPAFLMAADLPLPKQLFVHSHWTVGHEKMSKSKGNVVDVVERANYFTSDGLRYFLLREGVPHSDGNYSDVKAGRILNAELANTWGNLLERCVGRALNPGQVLPKLTDCQVQLEGEREGQELWATLSRLPDDVMTHFEQFNFYSGIDAVMEVLRHTNLFFERQRPWDFKKDPTKKGKLDVTLGLAGEVLRVTGILMQPVVPTLTDKLLTRLGVSASDRRWSDARPRFRSQDSPLGTDASVLFQRLQLVTTQEGSKKDEPTTGGQVPTVAAKKKKRKNVVAKG